MTYRDPAREASALPSASDLPRSFRLLVRRPRIHTLAPMVIAGFAALSLGMFGAAAPIGAVILVLAILMFSVSLTIRLMRQWRAYERDLKARIVVDENGVSLESWNHHETYAWDDIHDAEHDWTHVRGDLVKLQLTNRPTVFLGPLTEAAFEALSVLLQQQLRERFVHAAVRSLRYGEPLSFGRSVATLEHLRVDGIDTPWSGVDAIQRDGTTLLIHWKDKDRASHREQNLPHPERIASILTEAVGVREVDAKTIRVALNVSNQPPRTPVTSAPVDPPMDSESASDDRAFHR